MKYIILERNLGDGSTQEYPVLFPDFMVHKDVYEALCMANINTARKMGGSWEKHKAVAAGFVEGLTIKATSRESETMGLTSRKDDATLINAFQYFHGLR